jgi:hypothetical protein
MRNSKGQISIPDFEQLLERMRGRATSGMSTREIMELTRGES